MHIHFSFPGSIPRLNAAAAILEKEGFVLSGPVTAWTDVVFSKLTC